MKQRSATQLGVEPISITRPTLYQLSYAYKTAYKKVSNFLKDHHQEPGVFACVCVCVCLGRLGAACNI